MLESNAATATAMAFALLGMAAVGHGQEDRIGEGPRTLSVSGEGTVAAAPDVAEINVGVVTEAESARGALSSNNEAMSALRGQLEQLGIAAKDVQTVNINLSPKYSQPIRPLGGVVGARPSEPEEMQRRIVGYTVTNTVRVTARDLGRLGEVLDAVVTAGANQMNGIAFRVDEPRWLLDEARTLAMVDARRKAERLCEEAGMTLGKPLQISESSTVPQPRPMMARAMMAAESVPVAPGEQDLSASVQVTYEMTVGEGADDSGP